MSLMAYELAWQGTVWEGAATEDQQALQPALGPGLRQGRGCGDRPAGAEAAVSATHHCTQNRSSEWAARPQGWGWRCWGPSPTLSQRSDHCEDS